MAKSSISKNSKKYLTDLPAQKRISIFLFFVFAFLVISISILVPVFLAPGKLISAEQTALKENDFVRNPVAAGHFYPSSEIGLNDTINRLLEESKIIDFNGKEVKAIIVPHAGYNFSGKIAALSYKQLETTYEKIIILSPSHYYSLNGAAASSADYFKTPLGLVKVLGPERAKSVFEVNDLAHEKEHAVEVQLPFLQRVYYEPKIFPIVVGQMDYEYLADLLSFVLDENDLLIMSVDLSHYYNYNEAKMLDNESINNILGLDSKSILKNEIDSPFAVAALLKLAKEKNWAPVFLGYANSGDTGFDKSSVVGYTAIAFVGEKNGLAWKKTEALSNYYSDYEKETLLYLARESINQYLRTGLEPTASTAILTQKLKEKKGCFVTLNKEGELRGCIGTINPIAPLYKCVIRNAINAAIKDTRFNKVNLNELDLINLEISILSEPQQLQFNSTGELLQKVNPSIDGVVLSKGFYSATYLPQVWEDFRNKEEFLSSLCEKASLNKTCWQEGGIEVKTYQAVIFEEE